MAWRRWAATLTAGRALAAAACAALGAHGSPAAAQDSQYWTAQYGPVAELLGGVVVGSTRDLSATFYNPGALALAQDPSLLASVQSFEATWLSASAEGSSKGLSSSNVRPSPSLFAFALPRSWTGSHTIAISSLTRTDFDLRVDDWQVASQGGAESLFDQSLNENWFGISWAHKVGQDGGLGLTTYGVYRGQRTRREISGQAALSPTSGGTALLVEDFDYANYRLLWKAGFSRQLAHWDLGISVTTPSVQVFGSGTASYTRSAVGADLGGGPVVSVSVQHQEDLASRFDSPLSIALGGAYRRGQNQFHATVEWFDSVDPFDVLDPSGLTSDPAAEGLVKRLNQEAKSVVNFGLGFQRRVSTRFSYYAAFTTDFTFADKDDSAANSLSTWDIYHVTAGTSLVVGSAKLTMGGAYSFGGDDRQIATLSVPPTELPVLTQTAFDVRYSRVRLLVGFDFGR
ncbi:MAG TPA: hypothetical protein VFQ51_10370 [Vicinamibacteria bacterium]|nr:hypothetical protein [Vicinamibacteria bacterium]